MITSLQNELIKDIVRLRKARVRKKEDLAIVDGLREIKVAFDYGYEFAEILYCPEISEEKWHSTPIPVTEVSLPVFQKIAYAENPNGWLALIRPKRHSLDELAIGKNPLILVLEAVEKPGNLGAMLRTAYAAGIDAVILNNLQTDLYNPNVIKASSGHVFSDQVVVAKAEDTYNWLVKRGVKIYATNLKAAVPYTKVDWKEAAAIIMGTEATGLSEYWIGKADQNIIIPMKPGIDSLNVSVSAAVVIFEAKRQRDKS
ncbi:MAG: TrmH family RNA methyltransferase [Bacillota bacterium]